MSNVPKGWPVERLSAGPSKETNLEKEMRVKKEKSCP
jgi:hypothetical protein